ncbi:ABC transporter substrate-binding protein [Brevibacillus humidisoli]|uniref:ABC transporter substrate-binding protein n=1 Tax=Brevibacillus humidisoli TaxID=2895522 RepID=UPI001E48F219|nr:ABC transporter substrate-binding protein [Brevibacillus humidisoli]UFJ41596.1 ABC transporter substrate-binding protein [Brevibacillus humidisoli]
MGKRKKWASLITAGLLVTTLLAGCGGGQTSAPASGTEAPAAGSTGGSAPDSSKGTIKIGGLFDETGATGDVGKPYAEGEVAYVDYINSKGGINGYTIELIGVDYAYKVPEAVKIYQKFIKQDKVSAILGWGTGDTEAMKELIAKDKVPFLSASYSEPLTNVSQHPYNFLAAATYSDQARAVLKWIKDNWQGSGNPKVALIYNDTPFGKSPIEDAKVYANEIGVDIVDEQIVDLTALDATSQLLNMQKKNPDFAIIQETWGATATILKDAKKLGITTQFIGLNWAAGEGVITLAGDAAEGYIGVITHAFPYETLPGMKEVEEYLASKGEKLTDHNQKFIQGWVTAKILLEGIKNAGDNLTGEGIKAGMEKIQNLDLGGLGARVSFSADNHRGTNQIRLGQVKGDRFEMITDYIGY